MEFAPFTSKDVDFFDNPEAASRLADALHGELRVPDPDDQTPSAALVVGALHNRRIAVDFMRVIKGVDDSAIRDRFITLKGTPPGRTVPISIRVLHPLDCVRSRLANINHLHRTGDLSIRQARVSIIVLEKFIDELIRMGVTKAVKHAQRTLHDLEYVIRGAHCGQKSHLDADISLTPEASLRKFLDHSGLDSRWRDRTLAKAVERTEDQLLRSFNRLAEAYRADKAARQVKWTQRANYLPGSSSKLG